MEKIIEIAKWIFAFIGAGFTYLFGAWDTALAVLIVFMVCDYVTGLLKGWYNKELSSDVGLKGIARKFLILIVLIMAVVLDRLLNDGTWIFRSLVCYFYVANEGISILENVVVLGLPVPEQIKNALIQLQNKDKE